MLGHEGYVSTSFAVALQHIQCTTSRETLNHQTYAERHRSVSDSRTRIRTLSTDNRVRDDLPASSMQHSMSDWQLLGTNMNEDCIDVRDDHY